MALLATVAFGAMACAKRSTNSSSSSSGFTGGGGVARTATVEPTELTANLAAQSGGKGSGTAKFVAGSPGTKITVEMKDLPAGTHKTYIYHGSCEGQGEKHGPLTELTAGADGAATATTQFVAFGLGHFVEGDHYLAVHAATGDNPGPVISCGKIEDTSPKTGS